MGEHLTYGDIKYRRHKWDSKGAVWTCERCPTELRTGRPPMYSVSGGLWTRTRPPCAYWGDPPDSQRQGEGE